MAILAIESSCDETAAAIVDLRGQMRANVVRSQEKLHAEFGGIVPEVASRSHSAFLLPTIEQALLKAELRYRDLKAIAVTAGPGLLGSLLVGVTTAKSLAMGLKVPLLAVDHLEAHIAAAFIAEPTGTSQTAKFPLLALVISGGHSAFYQLHQFGQMQLLGTTQDDAVGEAYDKVAALLGLGYPGGPVIDKLAGQYEGDLIPFTAPMLHSKDLDLSFSGLKTAVVQYLRTHPARGKNAQVRMQAQVAASFQEAVAKVIVAKMTLALQSYPEVQQVVVCGGVACNQRLRQEMQQLPAMQGRQLLIPPPKFCTDNAAMIACLGWHQLQKQQFAPLTFSPYTTHGTLRA